MTVSYRGLGATNSLDNQGRNKVSQNGAQQFIKLGKTTMELNIIMRQDEEQRELRELLKNVRIGYPSESDKDVLLSLHLNSSNFTQSQIKDIEENATYIFANKKDMMEHNWEKLREKHSVNNPVARISTQTTTKGITYKGRAKCIKKETDIEPMLNICRGAKVQITGKNFEPDWGLFNGAVGKVIEIVYKEGTSPLDGTFPEFVIVDIPTYRGPPWINDKPTWVPIPPIEMNCRKHCCSFKFIPLSLAFAKTGHTFQGQTVGPNHAIKCIIVHPGNKGMECLCPGLLYMFASRPTTIGSKDDRSKSGLFFCGGDMNRDRISNLTKTREGKECVKIKNRRKWVNFLRNHRRSIKVQHKEKEELIKWANNTRIDGELLQTVIDDDSWRCSELLNY
jgi:hypothetical protein